MAKLFAVTIIVIAIASAVPIVLHIWGLPQDISVDGKLIDEQFSATMVETGICFMAAQLLLGFSSGGFPTAGATRKSSPFRVARVRWWLQPWSWSASRFSR
jgi:hypothetical protein